MTALPRCLHEKSSSYHRGVEEIRCKLAKHEESRARLSYPSLRLHSMRENYSLELLEQFYNEHMIPHFPLEDERDSLDDWIECLDPQKVAACGDQETMSPVMDILLLVCDLRNDVRGDESVQYETVLLAGVAFEYYQRAEVGLVSYVTVLSQYRKLGIMKILHPLAIQALKALHMECHFQKHGSLPGHGIRAIFAESNTANAKDGTTEKEAKSRHHALFRLGYRLIECPYSQPPLSTDQESFDDIMLLVYQGDDCNIWFDGRIPSKIPHSFLIDFFQSVFPATADKSSEHKMEGNDFPFMHHRCFKLSEWFAKNNSHARIKPNLPWPDVTKKYQKAYQDEVMLRKRKLDIRHEHQNIVVIVGAGAAGLSAAVRIAKETTLPVLVQLIEANEFVGGRIRSVITKIATDKEQYIGQKVVEKCNKFYPWPVPIGAEFVHGVNSVVNELIEDGDWRAEETFGFCGVDDYPSSNSFIDRELTTSLTAKQTNSSLVKIFNNGKCWDLNDPKIGDGGGEQGYGCLIEKANEVWEQIYSLGDCILPNNEAPIPSDKSLSSFIEDKMNGCAKSEIDAVKQIIDVIYAKTAGSSVEYYGVNEACREEMNWDYTESNFRTEHCFAELIDHYLKEVECINKNFEMGEGKGMIEIIKSTPIVKVDSDKVSKVVLTSKQGKRFTCDKAIIAVPLGVLKAKRIEFCGEFSLPPQKNLAIERINFFSGMKAHMLLLKGSCHSLETTDLFFCPGEIFSQVWVRRDQETIFLTGFVVADGRDKLLAMIRCQKMSSEAIFMEQLRRMLPLEVEANSCTAFEIHDWSQDEFIMGLYSSPSVDAGWRISEHSGDMRTARDDLQHPIQNSIFFAGEHANTKNCATVQAAIESGLTAATDVLKSIIT